MIEIVFASLADLDPLVDLLSRQFDEHDILQHSEQLAEATRHMLEDPRLGFFLLARHDAKPIGFAAVSFAWTLEHGGKSAWLDELYVLPAYRGKGVGGMLLDAVIRRAQDAGCRAIDLEVEAEHRRAEHLYIRKGFSPLNRTRWVKPLK